MSDDIKRLNFYEGQYLGFKDLRDEQRYHIEMRRRHNIAHHSWGIVTGLDLEVKETFKGSGQLEAFVMPGFAVDGFGREIILLRPHKLGKKCFLDKNEGFLKVWIAYEEKEDVQTDKCFNRCVEDENFSRVKESFRIFVGEPEEKHDSVVVSGEVKTPPEIPYDESVPYQDLPESEDGRWLVCLGEVKWDASGFVKFEIKEDDEEAKQEEAKEGLARMDRERQYLGCVASEILAPAGRLIIKDRTLEVLGEDQGVEADIEGSLTVERFLTVKKDAYILEKVGIGTTEPRRKISIKTIGDGWVEGLDIKYGEEGHSWGIGVMGENNSNEGSFTVEHFDSDDSFHTKLLIDPSGKVGVGTTEPQNMIDIKGNAVIGNGYAGAKEAPSNSLLVEGSIGVGTTEPKNKLDVKGGAVIGESYSGTNPGAPPSGLLVEGNVGIGRRNPDRPLHIKESASSSANGLRIENADNSRNLRLWVGTGGAVVDAYSDANLHLRTNGTDRLFIKNSTGNVGIGTTSPDSKLSIQGNAGALRLYSGKNNGHFWIGLYVDGGPGSTRAGWIGYGSDGTKNLSIRNEKNGGRIVLNPGDEDISSGVLQINGEDINCNNDLYLNYFSEKDVIVQGDLIVHGSKSGYVIDRFVNKSGGGVQQGDVVVLGKGAAEIHYGLDDNIPVPEVDLTTKPYDHRVCGIVAEILAERAPSEQGQEDLRKERSEERKPAGYDGRIKRLQTFSNEELSKLDRKLISSGQIGKMVTMGCFAHCKVDADIAPIEVGDLLTTSSTKGHAQKVLDQKKAIGAIIGKSLGSLENGKGKIPILVMMQ